MKAAKDIFRYNALLVISLFVLPVITVEVNKVRQTEIYIFAISAITILIQYLISEEKHRDINIIKIYSLIHIIMKEFDHNNPLHKKYLLKI